MINRPAPKRGKPHRFCRSLETPLARKRRWRMFVYRHSWGIPVKDIAAMFGLSDSRILVLTERCRSDLAAIRLHGLDSETFTNLAAAGVIDSDLKSAGIIC